MVSIDDAINKCVKALREGKIVIYPTESSYAIGCDILNENSLKKVYEIKRRDFSKKLTCIVDSIEMARKYCYLSEKEIKFLVLSYPLPITLIARKKEIVPDLFNDEFPFRIPSNLISLELVKRFGRPITATSANISKQPSIYKEKEIVRKFKGKVDYILCAGDLPHREHSSIVRLYKGKLEIIREGIVKKDVLIRIFENVFK